MTAPNDRVDAYLDRLAAALDGGAVNVRRVVIEIESHLYDAVDEGIERGLDPDAAIDAALARIGNPRDIARRYRGPLVHQLVTSLAFLAAVGLLAIGGSGVLSFGMRAAFGDHFLAGDYNGITYTAARCADFERFHPGAGSCEAAASAHHADEVVFYRTAAGALGAAALAAWLVLRRRYRASLSHGMVSTVGTTLFGLAAAALALAAVNQLEGGAGQWLSAAVVSLAVAAAFGRSAMRELSPA